MAINKNALKRAVLNIHKLGLRLGVQILPSHYYSPAPNILELERTVDIWAKKSELPGISVSLDDQAINLRAVCTPYKNEYFGNKVYREAVSKNFGPGYGYIEAQTLHSFIRYYKPKRIIEVGGGVSTYCMIAASEMNRKETGQSSKIISIEPQPSGKLRALSQIELIPNHVQTVPLEAFAELEEGDLLFVDSSHTVKPGGDVNYLILEVLPRLQKGVIVHFHDILLPYDYPRDALQTFLHGTETSLLRAFLIFNHRASILFCLSHLHYERKEVLREVFPEYNPQEDVNGLQPAKYRPFDPIPEHFPSSIYIRIR